MRHNNHIRGDTPQAGVKRLFGETGMLKKIALAAVAATLIAGPAFASTPMTPPTSKPGTTANNTVTKPSINKKHKTLHKKVMTKKET